LLPKVNLNTTSSAYDKLVLRLPLGSNDQQDSSSFHPNIDVNYLGGGTSSMTFQTWEEVIETHHHPTPDTVGISMTSEKVRIDEGTIDDNLLSPIIKSEVSTLDRQPQDFEDLGVFFSPTTEINEDIIYTLGAFRLDDYIGSPLPSAQTSSNYEDLKDIKDIYFKKVKRRYNYWDYIKLIQYIDHTLFKLVEQFVPVKANLKTGLLIEPHYLERNKFARELPIVEDGQTMTPGSYNTIDFQIDPEKQFTLKGEVGGGNVVTTNNLLRTTGSNDQRQEQGTNFTIDVSGHILDEQQNIAQGPIKPRESFISNVSTTYPDGLYGSNRFMNGGLANIIDVTDPIGLAGVGEGAGFGPFQIVGIDLNNDGIIDENFISVFSTTGLNATSLIVNNTLEINSLGFEDEGLSFITTTTPGKEYILKFDNVTPGSGVTEIVKVRVYKQDPSDLVTLGLSLDPQSLLTFGGPGTLVSAGTTGEIEFIAETNKSIITFSSFNASGFAVNLTNFEIRERQNGTFVNPEIWNGNTKPSYVTHESSTILGNAPRAIKSRIYFESTEVRDNYTTIIQ